VVINFQYPQGLQSPPFNKLNNSLISYICFNLEIIIINDGSKDDTLEKLIVKFQTEACQVRARLQNTLQ
jgi:glycosyltransferase involved in cell wall biosynthesis